MSEVAIPAADGSRDRQIRQRREQVFVRAIGANGDHRDVIVGQNFAGDDAFVDAAQSRLDHFAALQHFGGLVALGVAQQHAEFVRLPGTEAGASRFQVVRGIELSKDQRAGRHPHWNRDIRARPTYRRGTLHREVVFACPSSRNRRNRRAHIFDKLDVQNSAVLGVEPRTQPSTTVRMSPA